MFGAAQARLRSETYRKLGAMLRAGVSIGEATSSVAEEMGPSRLREALLDAGDEASRGRSLAETMGERERVFSPLTVAMVAVGEQAGRLEESLRTLAEYFERDCELRHLLTREATYPLLLFAGILFIPVIGEAILVWLTDTLAAALVTLITGLLLTVLYVAVPVGAALLVVRAMSGSREGRANIERIKLSIPVIGAVLRKLAVARFCRALASLYASGVMMGTSLELAADAAGGEIIRGEAREAARAVEDGSSLSEALAESEMLPPTALAMLRTGERTGTVDEMAENVADHLQQEAETSIRQMTASLVPAAVIIGGIIVGIRYIGFFLNLYSGAQ